MGRGRGRPEASGGLTRGDTTASEGGVHLGGGLLGRGGGAHLDVGEAEEPIERLPSRGQEDVEPPAGDGEAEEGEGQLIVTYTPPGEKERGGGRGGKEGRSEREDRAKVGGEEGPGGRRGKGEETRQLSTEEDGGRTERVAGPSVGPGRATSGRSTRLPSLTPVAGAGGGRGGGRSTTMTGARTHAAERREGGRSEKKDAVGVSPLPTCPPP